MNGGVGMIYLFLNSDARNGGGLLVGNQPNQFSTLLHSPLILDPDQSYQVALFSITCSSTYINLKDSTFTYYSYEAQKYQSGRVPAMYYSTPNMVQTSLRTVLGNMDFDAYELRYDPNTGYMYMDVKKGRSESAVEPFMLLSPDWTNLTGLPRQISGVGRVMGTEKFNVNGNSSTVYITSDIAGDSHYKNRKLSALNQIGLDGGGAGTFFYEFKNPLWLDVKSAGVIDTVDVTCLSQDGSLFQFATGTDVSIVLGIRPKLYL